MERQCFGIHPEMHRCPQTRGPPRVDKCEERLKHIPQLGHNEPFSPNVHDMVRQTGPFISVSIGQRH